MTGVCFDVVILLENGTAFIVLVVSDVMFQGIGGVIGDSDTEFELKYFTLKCIWTMLVE